MTVASSEQRVASSAPAAQWVLRALIRNDEALIEHYAQWAEQLEPEPTPTRSALLGSLGDTIRRLQLRRMALENLTARQPLCTTHER